jgi:hypothetical protein
VRIEGDSFVYTNLPGEPKAQAALRDYSPLRAALARVPRGPSSKRAMRSRASRSPAASRSAMRATATRRSSQFGRQR